jgi:hypothetical protein
MPGKTKIVFLDACRDNPLQRTGDRSVTKGLAPISVAEGTLISYATKDGPALVRQISGVRRIVRLFEIINE